MRLVDLEPQFIRRELKVETWTRVLGDPRTYKPGDPTEQVTGPREYYVPVSTMAGADGIMFRCPKCFTTKGGPGGVHSVLCWRPRVPPDVDPKPGRWEFTGTGYADLSLVAGSSSVALHGGCAAHFFVQGGLIQMC
jgi:hypothetical protein